MCRYGKLLTGRTVPIRSEVPGRREYAPSLEPDQCTLSANSLCVAETIDGSQSAARVMIFSRLSMVLSNRSDHDVPVPGRHRQLQRTGLIVTAAAVAVVVVTTGSLKVTAAPEIAPAVRAAADTWARGDDAKVDDACITVTVVGAKAPSMAAAIAARHGVSLQGVGA